MDAIVAQIQNLAQTADEAGRLNIIKALRDVQTQLHSPKDTLMEIVASSLIGAVARLGADLGIFQLLVNNDAPLSVDQIAKQTGASPQLLERVLRYLASKDMIKEVGPNTYTANTICGVLADQNGEATIYHSFDTHGPVVQAMPDFLAENHYQDITDNTNTPFQKAFNTKLPVFEWLVQHPKNFGTLQKVMTAMQGSEWTEGFKLLDVEARKVSTTPPNPSEKPFLVDVGGGHGHQCIKLGNKYPNLLGRLVLQDLAEAVEKLPQIKGVKAEAYDFFQKQPITGATFYYLRRIMHDWPDHQAAEILRNVAAAFGPGSRILIDEVVLPDTGASWQATTADLAMMAFAGKERTKSQWGVLAESAGLRVEQIHEYIAFSYTSIIVLALK